MPKAKLTFQDRKWLETQFLANKDQIEICEELGISTYQLQMEKKLGWMKEKQMYSAEKAQQKL